MFRYFDLNSVDLCVCFFHRYRSCTRGADLQGYRRQKERRDRIRGAYHANYFRNIQLKLIYQREG